MNHNRFLPILLAVLAPLAALRAQDPEAVREIQEIARRVDEQLQEIDRLLLESGKKGQARSKPKDLLQQAKQRSESVEGGIDELIDKLNQMKNQSGSGQPDEDQQSQGQQGQQRQQQQQQGQQNRRENQTPDLVDRRKQQGQQQPGQQQPGQQEQQPGEQPQDGKPEGGQESKDGGQNRPGRAPDDGGVGPANAATGDGTWGELQPYMNFMKNRGSRPPQVPEKFRKYWEAYLKQKPTSGTGGSGK